MTNLAMIGEDNCCPQLRQPPEERLASNLQVAVSVLMITTATVQVEQLNKVLKVRRTPTAVARGLDRTA